MFGALNRFISRLDSDPQAQQTKAQRDAAGFHVLKNANQELSIEPWFDFIIGINGRTIDNPDPTLFATELQNCAGSTISLGVYSAKGQRIREVYASVPSDPPNLGLSLHWTPLTATEDVWHILDISPNSPADLAGLLPYGDYVIGSPEGTVKGESGLVELIEEFVDRPLRLYVYNHEYDVLRPVTITPSRNWGGNGLLGCVLGFGALHRIPAPLNEPPSAPGETMFEAARLSNEDGHSGSAVQESNMFSPLNPAPLEHAPNLLVPANAQYNNPSPPPPAGGVPSHKAPQKSARKGRSQQSAALSMDDYFKEGEAKSKEMEGTQSSRPSDGSVPPPPKAPGTNENPPVSLQPNSDVPNT
ncbi:MAG: hypothetical protein M1821_008725 [Bathelium mastoideum]|nr:MAG: hypothetical protein M1821_008725 [Bathelium mastoideum]KAI9685885.1 MAG: hypothetical protein M1822_004163 [Bathelium mastoideum]